MYSKEENELEWELQSKELSFPYEKKHVLCVNDREIKEERKDEEFRLKNQTTTTKISLNPATLKCYIFIMPPE